MTPQPGTLANIESSGTLRTPAPSDSRRRQGRKLHLELQRLGLSSAIQLKPNIDKWFAECHRAVVYGVRTQMQMGLKPIAKGINLHKASTPAAMVARLVDWGCLDARGVQYIRPTMLEYAVRAANGSMKYTRFKGSFTMTNPEANRWASQHSARLVREITRAMRTNIRAAITSGVREGRGVGEIARQIKRLDGFALTTRQVGYVNSYRDQLAGQGLRGRVLNARVARYRDMKLRQRSIAIARTESISSLSEGTLIGWKKANVKMVEFMASSGACPVCADMDGWQFPIASADNVIAVHTNCHCNWLNRDQGTEEGLPDSELERNKELRAEVDQFKEHYRTKVGDQSVRLVDTSTVKNTATTADGLYKDAVGAAPKLRANVVGAASDSKGKAYFGPGNKYITKTKASLREKINVRGHPVDGITDAVRGTVVVEKVGDIPAATASIRSRIEASGGRVLMIDDKYANPFNKSGYVGLHIDAQYATPGGGIIRAEIQVHDHDMAAKAKAHEIYTRYRSKPEMPVGAMNKSIEGYVPFYRGAR